MSLSIPIPSNGVLWIRSGSKQQIREQFWHENMFPKEIWDQIFSHVSNSEDLFRLHNTCRHFRVLLMARSCDYLFGKILTLFHKFMSQNANLACRLVSTSWKGSVDELVEKQFTLEPLPYHDCQDTRLQPNASSYLPLHGVVVTPWSPPIMLFSAAVISSYHFENSFENYLRIGNFLNHMRAHDDESQSPFIGKVLSLKLSTVTQADIAESIRVANIPNIANRERIFWADLQTMIERYGVHVTSLNIEICNNAHIADSYNISSAIYLQYHDLLPNLKMLSINGIVPTYDGVEYNWLGTLGSPLLHTFEVKLSSMAVPSNVPLHELVHVRDCLESMPIMGVKRLSQTWNIWNNWDINSREWYGLSELYLTEIGTDFCILSIVNASLPNLVKFGVKPRHNVRYEGTSYSLTNVVHVLNGLASKSKLHTFVSTGGFPRYQMHDAIVNASAQINHVEHVDEMGYGNIVGANRFSYLTRFPCLETLRITWAKSGYGHDLHFLRLRAELDASSVLDDTDLNKLMCNRIRADRMRIWSIMPNLKFLYVNERLFCRK